MSSSCGAIGYTCIQYVLIPSVNTVIHMHITYINLILIIQPSLLRLEIAKLISSASQF